MVCVSMICVWFGLDFGFACLRVFLGVVALLFMWVLIGFGDFG